MEFFLDELIEVLLFEKLWDLIDAFGVNGFYDCFWFYITKKRKLGFYLFIERKGCSTDKYICFDSQASKLFGRMLNLLSLHLARIGQIDNRSDMDVTDVILA